MTLSVIKYSDLIKIDSVNRIVSRVPFVIEVEGQDFSSVSEVLVNDVVLPEFVIVNQKVMYLTIPPNIRQVRTISVRSSSFTRTTTGSIVEYKVGNKTKIVSGILRLTQLYIRYLLTSPGSDIFNPIDGGGLQDIVGAVGTSGNTTTILGALGHAVRKTSEDVTRAQSGRTDLALDERLLSATLVDLRSTRHSDSAEMRILITSYAGTEATANLSL